MKIVLFDCDCDCVDMRTHILHPDLVALKFIPCVQIHPNKQFT